MNISVRVGLCQSEQGAMKLKLPCVGGQCNGSGPSCQK